MARTWIAITAGVALTGSVGAGDWQWSAGPVWRGGMHMRGRGSSYVQDGGVYSGSGTIAPTAIESTPSGLGADTGSGYADRTFDDGFVFIDPSTSDNGDTWYWGYNSAGQYDSGAGTLSFHRRYSTTSSVYGERYAAAATVDSALDVEEAMQGAGVGIALERRLGGGEGRLSVAIATGLDAVWGINGRAAATTFEGTATREQLRQDYTTSVDGTFTYDLMGVVPPTAPYRGSYDGPGPLLRNQPHSVSYSDAVTAAGGTVVQSRSTSQGHNRVDLDVNATLYALWLGPSVAFRAGQRAQVDLRPQVSLNLVNAQVNRTEDWYQTSAGQAGLENSWNDSESCTSFIPGYGLYGRILFSLGGGWMAGATGGYDWLIEDCEATVGPSKVALDLSGYTLSVLIGKSL
jgi:hypothetical protein